MAIIREKTNFVLEVKHKFTYRIFRNGNNEMSIEVQLTDDFKKANFRNYATATMSVEDFERRMSLRQINGLFLLLRKRIAENGCYFELHPNNYNLTEI